MVGAGLASALLAGIFLRFQILAELFQVPLDSG